MSKNRPTYNYISDYLVEVQSKGRFTISLKELKSQFDVSEKALLQNVFRLKVKNKIAQVRKEFYVIIPPQYSNRGMIPPSLFMDDMMELFNRDYYIGLFSAAALHGAGHQQPMEFQVITKKPPLRNIKNKSLNISFFVKKNWLKDQIVEKKTETGYINVSSPEMTAFDLVYYSKKIGGLNRIIPILEDISEAMKPSLIAKTVKNQKLPTVQRLGYLLNKIGKNELANSLYKTIENLPVSKTGAKLKEVPLSLAHTNRTGEMNEQWKIKINIKLDIE